MRDVVGAAGRYLGDLAGNEVTGVDETPVRLDRLEMPPGLLGQLVGEVLDEPRTARGVQHPSDV